MTAMTMLGRDNARTCTFRAAMRGGVWQVTRDHIFYGDYLSRKDALEGACSGAISFEANGGVSRVLAPPGDTLIAHDALPLSRDDIAPPGPQHPVLELHGLGGEPADRKPAMTSDQQHRCTVQIQADGSPYLAFQPASGEISSYSNSLFTLDLLPGVTVAQARELAAQINMLLRGVSATVF